MISSPGTIGSGEIPPLTHGTLTPALPEADDEVLETLPRDRAAKVKLTGVLTFGGVSLDSRTEAETETGPRSLIVVGMDLSFDEKGELKDLEFTNSTQIEDLSEPFPDPPLIVAYGANRHLGQRNLNRFADFNPLDYERLSWITELCDVEELLMTLDYAARADDANPESRVRDLLKDAISTILPKGPTVGIEIHPPDVLSTGRPGGIYARTFSGVVRLSQLSLGYRTTASWVVDFAWRLTNRYPNSPKPTV